MILYPAIDLKDGQCVRLNKRKQKRQHTLEVPRLKHRFIQNLRLKHLEAEKEIIQNPSKKQSVN